MLILFCLVFEALESFRKDNAHGEELLFLKNGKIQNGKNRNQLSSLKSGSQFLKSLLPLSVIPIIWKTVLFLLCVLSQKSSCVHTGITLSSKIKLRKIYLFIILSFLIHENSLFLYLFRSSSVIF